MGGCCHPLSDFDCHLVNLPTICPDTHISMRKNSKKNYCEKSWGVGAHSDILMMGGGANRVLYFILKKIPTSEFVYPKKSLRF